MHYKSVFEKETDLLRALMDVHLGGQTVECDPMYFKGNFYKGIPEPYYKFDISPLKLGVDENDARNLPLGDGDLNSIILDPPFMFGNHGKQRQYYSSSTHGILKSFEDIEVLYQGIIKEAYRVLCKNGVLIFKCQDYTDSKTTMTHCLVWQWASDAGFYPKDLAILHLPTGKVANSQLTQRHLRKTHSYFWVFIK